MIQRHLQKELLQLMGEYPVVTILGPRQSGKTTLAKMTFPSFHYCNLESPEIRLQAEADPKYFLQQFSGPVIFDEIQRVPDLLSYIQVLSDKKKLNGQYVLTGSHQLELRQNITQSLAGRTALLHLLPFSISELQEAGISWSNFATYVIHGFLPRIYDQKQRPQTAYSNYYQTYVERDVRQIMNLREVTSFEKFLKLMAGRVGQLINYASISNDIGVDVKTIKNWLSLLEASFILYRLNPYFENIGKRQIKSSKYYFMDVGLLAFLLGIETEEQVRRDPLMGAIFENLVIIEALKSQYHQGKVDHLYFYRDQRGNEVDLIYQKGRQLIPIEIKTSSTLSKDQFKGLEFFQKTTSLDAHSYLIYNGEETQWNPSITCIHYSSTSKIFENSSVK